MAAFSKTKTHHSLQLVGSNDRWNRLRCFDKNNNYQITAKSDYFH